MPGWEIRFPARRLIVFCLMDGVRRCPDVFCCFHQRQVGRSPSEQPYYFVCKFDDRVLVRIAAGVESRIVYPGILATVTPRRSIEPFRLQQDLRHILTGKMKRFRTVGYPDDR